MLFFNVVLVITTLLAYLLPFLAPKWFPFLSVLTLFLPFFLVLNLLFFVYWLIQLKKYIFVSGLVLLLGITFINKFYNLKQTELPKSDKDFTIMSYNVRLFNKFKWYQKANIPAQISQFVDDKNPDILCVQEYSDLEKTKFSNYKYQQIFKEGKNIIVGNAIFSKYKIIDKGVINFPNSTNNAVYADIIKDKDTLRIYSMHLQSIKISTDIEDEEIQKMNESKTKYIFRKISEAFTKQQEQALLLKAHYSECKYKKIICGDMNNSAFSFVYRTIKGSMQDTFETSGSGFGKTYNFKYYPARIDYIFADKTIQVKSFETLNDFYNSDHFPLISRLEIK
ncbi:endonuclease/exonuclease/phosphatase family protein [Flavobacterium sp. F372]|uniref:Endonuclease/exonuclease/phosphatase family protein n=1 Tax=Flavobacterium bernardetii TaxID=2813823 RepID=A0ABR7IXW3_9FLAO|nr:endonuclease/exonuclease/phosphatase family protein [Flavobacterium bernardetii]MBC5834624.1 endonuclease/exonuclease/phosphatase family protein [Flavobacterium bernardetii]NHF70272.1 endonuclease/exonuclease/phosphatase family protein [Flavobacterium bernardetii]